MLIIIFAGIVSIIIPTIVATIFILTSSRSLLDREKTSPFECGFDPNHKARVPFSLRFFLLAIIFIVFDIEIVLLIPLPLIYNLSSSSIYVGSSIFLAILILGLYHEWSQGSLDWSN